MMPQESELQRWLWLGLLGLVVLWFFALIFHGPVIERRLGEEVHERLAAAGFERIVVEVRGRDVVLQGEVSGQAALRQGVALAQDVQGVRVVHDKTRQFVVRLPWLRITRETDDGWAITGVLPDNDAREKLAALLQSLLPGRHSVKLETDPEAGDPAWMDAIGELLPHISDLDRGRLEIGAGFIEVGGEVSDIARHSVMERALNQYAADSRMTLVNRIALLPPRRTQAPEKSAN